MVAVRTKNTIKTLEKENKSQLHWKSGFNTKFIGLETLPNLSRMTLLCCCLKARTDYSPGASEKTVWRPYSCPSVRINSSGRVTQCCKGKSPDQLTCCRFLPNRFQAWISWTSVWDDTWCYMLALSMWESSPIKIFPFPFLLFGSQTSWDNNLSLVFSSEILYRHSIHLAWFLPSESLTNTEQIF